MILDSRIEKDSLIYTPFSNAKINLNENGYFANDIKAFSDLKKCEYGELVGCDLDLDYPYWRRADMNRYAFYIPESSLKQVENNLKPVEKKYRPYTLTEFQDKFTIGRPIKFRKKGDVGRERYLTLVGYENVKPNGQAITYIYLGLCAYTLDELFNKYEWQEYYTEDFEPFGVEEE